MAQDAVAFIRALGFDRVDLLGLSMGGFITQVIAEEESQLVRKIILAGKVPPKARESTKLQRSPFGTSYAAC